MQEFALSRSVDITDALLSSFLLLVVAETKGWLWWRRDPRADICLAAIHRKESLAQLPVDDDADKGVFRAISSGPSFCQDCGGRKLQSEFMGDRSPQVFDVMFLPTGRAASGFW